MIVARVAAMLPCSPLDLLDLDLSLFNELAHQVEHREQEWTRRDEMAAQQMEMLHLLIRTTIQVNSSKSGHIPAFHYPRPGEITSDVVLVDHRDMMKMVGGAH